MKLSRKMGLSLFNGRSFLLKEQIKRPHAFLPGKSYTQRQIVKIVLLDWIEGIKLLKPSFNLSFTDKKRKKQ